LTPTNLSACNQALHIIHRRLMELQMETQEVRGGEEAEHSKVDKGDKGGREAIGTSFVT
jgi:hypothetical protein